MKDEALDLVLEALEQGIDGQTSIQMDKAIAAIKQARSAPVQGLYKAPDLSTLKHSDNCRYWDDSEFCTCGAAEYHELNYWKTKALAAQAQEPVALRAALDEAKECFEAIGADGGKAATHAVNTISYIRSALYTTPPAQPAPVQPVQEPEYVYTCNGCDTLYREDDVSCDCTVRGLMQFTRHILMPDTTPPAAKRPRVGLTDEEYFEMGQRHCVTSTKIELIHAEIEAKLLEKNT